MEAYYDFEVPKEDELLLRNQWKLPATCQFINMFRNVLKIKDPLTPYDLEQSLLRPQHDPLCGELMIKLMSKRQLKKDGNAPVSDSTQQNLEYNVWNEMLAKRFAMMYKNYRKLSIKFLGRDPMLSQIKE